MERGIHDKQEQREECQGWAVRSGDQVATQDWRKPEKQEHNNNRNIRENRKSVRRAKYKQDVQGDQAGSRDWRKL